MNGIAVPAAMGRRCGRDTAATPQDLDTLALPDDQAWLDERRAYLCY